MELKDLLKITPLTGIGKKTASFKVDLDEEKLEPIKQVLSLIAAAGPIPHPLWATPESLYQNVLAALYQDADAHDTCSLTACLNPLHPGPCKGWKGTLFDTAPAAFHALEKAKTDKANATRIKKIEDLKSKGLPIPKKLLVEIKPKASPHEGKTAKVATGEAHAASQAISEASGVHVNEPGKVSLGQAVKKLGTDATEAKGAKGIKPTVASKGIAHVIAQEKVTPQYKLDKASKITPEQWGALSADEKSVVRGELVKIKKDGFGPQQKKADELLAKLPADGPTHEVSGEIKAPSGVTYQKVSLKDSATPKPPTENAPAPKTSPATQTVSPLGAQKLIKQHGSVDITLPGSYYTPAKTYKDVGVSGDHEHLLKNEGAGKWYLTDGKGAKLQFLTKQGGIDVTVPAGKAKEPEASKVPTATVQVGDTVKGNLIPGEHVVAKIVVKDSTHKNGHKAHSLYDADGKEFFIGTPASKATITKPKEPEASKLGDLKPGTPGTVTAPSGKVYQKLEPKTPTAPEAPKTPAHVTHAVSMAKGEAPGSAWAKHQLTAYQPLSKAEFDALPQEHQDKIVQDLKTGQAKFLDPKKIAASKELLAKFGHGGTAPVAPKTPGTPKPEDMSGAMLADHASKLLGSEKMNPKLTLTLEDEQKAKKLGGKVAADELSKFPGLDPTDPAIAAKYLDLQHAEAQLLMADKVKQKVDAHIGALKTATHDVNGNSLTATDKQILKLHAANVENNAAFLDKSIDAQEKKEQAAHAAFKDAASKAHAAATPAQIHSLTDFDKATIGTVFTNAWAKHADSAVNYGVKTYDQIHKMKAHEDFPAMAEGISKLKALSGELALAHAHEHTALLNVPTDPDTGALDIHAPQWKVWRQKVDETAARQAQFNAVHKQTQAKLDTIRTSVGLKKRAIPKLDAAAVKSSAAESAFHKTSAYSGPLYGKHASAKAYLPAKVGDKLGVKHQTAFEKKHEKLADSLDAPAAPKASTSKIENKAEPVKVDGGDIAHIPDALKKKITQDFKENPTGKFLTDPTEKVFKNAVNLAAAHGKGVDGGLSVAQVIKTVDETHAKNLGFTNSGMMHEKLVNWLQTPAGKAYAEANSKPDAKKVKELTGEITLPEGVTLAPGEHVQKLAGPGPFDKSLKAKDFQAWNAEKAQDEQDAHFAANGIKLSAAQKKDIKAYTGNGHGSYETFNDCLRDKGPCSAKTKQSVVNIQAAMQPSRENLLLKRGTGWPPGIASYQSHPEDLVGESFDDKGFSSSTVAGSSGHFSGKPLQLIIEAPKGTPMVFVNKVSDYKDTENEMLLAAGTKFKVLSVEKTTGGHTVMRVRVVGDK